MLRAAGHGHTHTLVPVEHGRVRPYLAARTPHDRVPPPVRHARAPRLARIVGRVLLLLPLRGENGAAPGIVSALCRLHALLYPLAPLGPRGREHGIVGRVALGISDAGVRAWRRVWRIYTELLGGPGVRRPGERVQRSVEDTVGQRMLRWMCGRWRGWLVCRRRA